MIIRVFAFHGDGGEYSRGPILGVCETELEAAKFAFGKGWYGGDGQVSKQFAIKCNGKMYLLQSDAPFIFQKDVEAQKKADQDLKEKTMKMLTREQIRVLGLDTSK